jgi:hypothetical protein
MNRAVFQWLTIFLAIVALGSLIVGSREVATFNNECTDRGFSLKHCWITQLTYLSGGGK